MVIEYLTAILVVITGIYAYLTHRMAKASEASVDAVRAQSEAMLRPYVTVAPFIRPHTPLLYLRITNAGRTGAQNVHLSIDRDFFQFGQKDRPDQNLRAVSAFTTPVDYFAPGAELIFGLGDASVLFEKDAKPEISPVQFKITAAYEFLGKSVEEVTHVDLRAYYGTEGERDPVVEELERIRKVMEQKK